VAAGVSAVVTDYEPDSSLASATNDDYPNWIRVVGDKLR
jgi:hypothetical protein